MGNNKRKNDSDNQSSKKQDTNACPKFSTPKQSMSNAHTQLKAISEHLCRNGHPAQGQSLDLNKIEPINLLPLITDYVKPQEYDAIVNVIPQPAPPVADPPVQPARPRRGRGGRNAPVAAQPDPPAAAAAANAPLEVQPGIGQADIMSRLQFQNAQMSAYLQMKMRKEQELRQEANDIKLKVVSFDYMTSDFYHVFVERVPHHNSLSIRDLARNMVTVYDHLLSQDPHTLRTKAQQSYDAMSMKETESLQEYTTRFKVEVISRNSKFPAEKALEEEEVSRKFIDSLNSNFSTLQSDFAKNQGRTDFLERNPEFDYPKTMAKAKAEADKHESLMALEATKGKVVGRTYLTQTPSPGKPKGKGKGKPKKGAGGKGGGKQKTQLLNQGEIQDFLKHKFKKVKNGFATTGEKLKSSDKPSEYGYKTCYICWKDGHRGNDHFQHFHNDFMSKVVGKNPSGSNYAITKNDFIDLGKAIAESVTAGIAALKD